MITEKPAGKGMVKKDNWDMVKKDNLDMVVTTSDISYRQQEDIVEMSSKNWCKDNIKH